MEKHQNNGTQIIVFRCAGIALYFMLACSCWLACTQKPAGRPSALHDTGSSGIGSNPPALGLLPDTSIIAVLSNRTIAFFSLRDSASAVLKPADFRTIESVLVRTVAVYNKGRDRGDIYSGYIDLGRYNRQYVAYTGKEGEKKVFINCFCRGIAGFGSWREKLVIIEDGGKCFFNITVSVDAQTAGALLINGPG